MNELSQIQNDITAIKERNSRVVKKWWIYKHLHKNE